MAGYEIDKDNPDMVKGWGVFRLSPWHLDGLFTSREEAELRAEELGTDYAAKFGSRRLGSDDFIAD